jgi:hypothetical protein
VSGTPPSALFAHRWTPVIVGVLTALAIGWVWAGAGGVPVMHDEWAYWLQGGQYGHGVWSQPVPPIPEFFEQLYVLVTPVFAAKYPPGHALVLAPGFAIGWPMLMPLLLSGVTGGVVFALARRVSGGGVALATWLFWLGTFGNLRFRASYFSETTSALCWLTAWWALLQWRADRRRSAMLLLAAAVGWCAITRPYTAVALALPIAVVIVRDVVRERRWTMLAQGILAGTLLVLVLPFWSWRTTGNWQETPLALYTRQYLPFDVPGFHLDPTPPERAVPPLMERTRAFLRGIKRNQVETPVLRTVASRALVVTLDAFDAWRLPLVIAFVVGLVTMGAAGWLAFGTGGVLIVAYGAQAHTADWTVYYLEALPAIAFATAMGLRTILRAAPRVGRVAPYAAVVVAALVIQDVLRARTLVERLADSPRRFRAAVAELPKRPNVVFVRYSPLRGANDMHITLVANEGVWSTAPSWIVHDRGEENPRLMRLAADRTAYLYDEASRQFTEIAR